MLKSATFTIRMAPDVKAALEAAARAEDRSASAQAERIIREWLVRGGHLASPSRTRKPKG